MSHVRTIETTLALIPASDRVSATIALQTYSPRDQGGERNAWVNLETRVLTVPTGTRMFKRAAAGDARPLAAALRHEFEHLRSGAAEAPAYDAQLALLRALGATPRDIRNIEAAKRFVVH